MRILITGHQGYIGSSMVPMFIESGHDVVGLDSGLFEGCTFGTMSLDDIPSLQVDIRDVSRDMLVGFNAVVHLAGISNDPVGDLDPQTTFSINHRASVRLAEMAKQAGVERFVFSSSCSLYGAGEDDVELDEEASFHPQTPYGESKIRVERDVAPLASDSFSPTFLRNATVYGLSPSLRADLVVNNLCGYACTTGQVLVMSDGTPWRPLVHVQDVCRTFLATVEAPRETVHNQAFNVGRVGENYRIREVADLVQDVVAGSRVDYAEDGGPDKRSYRVDFGKLARQFPDLDLTWTVRDGVEQLAGAFEAERLTLEGFTGSRYIRIERIQELMAHGMVDPELRRMVGVGPGIV